MMGHLWLSRLGDSHRLTVRLQYLSMNAFPLLIVKDGTRKESYLKVVEKLRSRLTTWP
jgi:hypothetical protein